MTKLQDDIARRVRSHMRKLSKEGVSFCKDHERTPYLTGALRNSIRAAEFIKSESSASFVIIYGGENVIDDGGRSVDVDYVGTLEFGKGRNQRHVGFLREKTIPALVEHLTSID